MSFQSEMEARYGSTSDSQLVRMTNPDDKDATTVNTTVLGAALDDVKGDFRDEAGVEYDDTDNRMVRIAVRGAFIYLKMNTAEHGSFDTAHGKYIDALRQLRKRTNANRLVPRLVDINKNTALDRTMNGLGINRIQEQPWYRSI